MTTKLVTFREFMTLPEFQPSLPLSGNEPRPQNFSVVDLSDVRVIDDINNHLERKLDEKFLTPYIALERMRKTLSPYGIIIPAITWLNGDDGEKVFVVNQWGGQYGSTGKGSNPYDVIDTNLEAHETLSVYMSWSYVSEKGVYDIYAAVVDAEQLNDLLNTDFDGTPFDDQDEEEDAMAASVDEDKKKPTKKETHEAAIAKLLAYAPHITRDQAIKQIGYDKDLNKRAKEKYKTQRGFFGIK